MSEGLHNERATGVTVKLPRPVACRLHRSDNGVGSSSATPMSQHSISQAILAAFAEIKNSNPLPNRRSEQSQYSTLVEASCEDEKSKPSPTLTSRSGDKIDKIAANTPEDALKTSQNSVTASNNLTFGPTKIVQATVEARAPQNEAGSRLPQYNDEQPPYELDGRETEIPYVHANSLTGYSNDRDVLNGLPTFEERHYLADSGVGLPIIISSTTSGMVGLKELVVDHDIMTPAYATSTLR